jgi:hypothetical protein
MQITVIDVYPNESIVEYEDADGCIQRRVIPQGLYNIVSRGPADLPDNIVNMGIEYSNVDLTQVLGEMLPPIRVRVLEDQLRRAGLWTQQDYKENAGAVSGVWQRMRGMDVSTIINAAFAKLG